MISACGRLTARPRAVRAVVFWVLLSGTILAGGIAAAFPVPERLEFELSYTGITAGHAVQEVTCSGSTVSIVSTAKSADWLAFFFPVDDRIESRLVRESGASLPGTPVSYTERIKEGRTRRHKEVRFDRERLEVTTRDLLRQSSAGQKITARTYDTLSSFYYFRALPVLQPGSSHAIDIFDGKRLWNTEVQVVRREELKTALGRFRTVVIKPLLKSEGIFARTGEMLIWLTDDDRRIPVQMKSKVAVGSITATLTGGSYWPTRRQ